MKKLFIKLYLYFSGVQLCKHEVRTLYYCLQCSKEKLQKKELERQEALKQSNKRFKELRDYVEGIS